MSELNPTTRRGTLHTATVGTRVIAAEAGIVQGLLGQLHRGCSTRTIPGAEGRDVAIWNQDDRLVCVLEVQDDGSHRTRWVGCSDRAPIPRSVAEAVAAVMASFGRWDDAWEKAKREAEFHDEAMARLDRAVEDAEPLQAEGGAR
jgi:hypothetical protein